MGWTKTIRDLIYGFRLDRAKLRKLKREERERDKSIEVITDLEEIEKHDSFKRKVD